jgi:hypothetical protein
MERAGDIHQSYSKHFNENYQLSKKLIEKLVERTMVNSFEEKYSSLRIQFPPLAIREQREMRDQRDHRTIPPLANRDIREIREMREMREDKKTRRIQKDQEMELETAAQDDFGASEEKSKRETIPSNFLESSSSSELFIQTPPPLNDEASTQPLASPTFFGSTLLPEYSQLKSKVLHSKGCLDLSNQHFGNHHIVAVTDALNSTDGDLRALSLKGNRLTDHGICEILRKLECLNYQHLMSLDLSNNKVCHCIPGSYQWDRSVDQVR